MGIDIIRSPIAARLAAGGEGWVFPSSRKDGPGHVLNVAQYHGAITEAGGTRSSWWPSAS